MQKVRVLQEFAQTELDSAWQSIFALERVKNPDLRKLLFLHAFEELFHSDLFARIAQRKSRDLPMLPLTRREPLLPLEGNDPKDEAEFFAFLAIGESEIQRDFHVYQRSLPDEDVQQLFQAIGQDEEYHAKDTGDALERLTGACGLSLPWIRLRHLGSLAYKRYVSVMNKFGVLPMTALFFVAYSLFGMIFARQARERLALAPGAQLDMLKRQQEQFDKKLAEQG